MTKPGYEISRESEPGFQTPFLLAPSLPLRKFTLLPPCKATNFSLLPRLRAAPQPIESLTKIRTGGEPSLQIAEISLQIGKLQGERGRDGFASDCILSQPRLCGACRLQEYWRHSRGLTRPPLAMEI